MLHAERLGIVAKARYGEVVETPPSFMKSVRILALHLALHDDDTNIHYPAVVARTWIAFEHSIERMSDRLLTGEGLHVSFAQIKDQPTLFPRPNYEREVDRRDVSYDARMFEPATEGGGDMESIFV